MTTRDRTGLFLRYREEARALHNRPLPSRSPSGHADHGSSDAPDDDSSEPTIISVAMEPDWVFSYNDLKGDLAELSKMLDNLANLYAHHLLPSFADKDTSHVENEIRILSHRLTDMLHTVEQKVRAVSKTLSPLPPTDPSVAARDPQTLRDPLDVERTIRRNLQRRFATPLQKLSLDFRKRQKDYLDKLKQMRDAYGDSHDNLDTVPLHNDDHTLEDQDSAFTEAQLQEVENSSALAEQRRREVSRVASNINDLATLVKDIANLVVDQGTVLDRVDYNLEDVRVKTLGATRELRIADRYQRKRHALCCIIILSIACGVMTMILIYKWTS